MTITMTLFLFLCAVLYVGGCMFSIRRDPRTHTTKNRIISYLFVVGVYFSTLLMVTEGLVRIPMVTSVLESQIMFEMFIQTLISYLFVAVVFPPVRFDINKK